MKKVVPIHEIVLGLRVQKSWPKVFSSKVFMCFHADSTYEEDDENGTTDVNQLAVDLLSGALGEFDLNSK